MAIATKRAMVPLSNRSLLEVPTLARRYILASDFSGKEIPEGEAAEVRVLSHPLIESPVKLDAQALELQSLLKKNQDLVTLELVLPGDDSPVQVLVALSDFDKLFGAGSPDDVLNSAEQYFDRALPGVAPRKRGRPRRDGSTKPSGSGISKEQREAIRVWARGAGYTIGDRGRISSEIQAAFDEAHKGS